MRNLILGATAALMVCALPGLAAAQTGYAGAQYTHSNSDPVNSDSFGVNGSLALDLGPNLGSQIDAGYQFSNPDSNTGLSDIDSWHLGGHLFHREATWQLGGALTYDTINPRHGDSADVWTGAVEGLYFQDHLTWGATLAYGHSDDLDTTDWTLNGEVRYFINDNFRLDGNLGFGSVDTQFDSSEGSWNIGVGAEYQLSTVPISFFGGYEHVNVDTSPGVDTDTFTIGARWNWGGTLYNRDRSGANLTSSPGISPLGIR